MNNISSFKSTLNTIQNMTTNNRLAHAFLLFGEYGVGKKTLAEFIALNIISTTQNVIPTNTHQHPDIIWVQHSGVKQGFSVEDLRKVCVDAYVLPNNGDRKVYILADCDNISISAQNTLLKIIEEPPPFTHFIFTASSKTVFLPTVLSRIISFGVQECSADECRNILTMHGHTNSESVDCAIDCFGGNIGVCLDFLNNGIYQKAVIITINAVDSLLAGSEYRLLLELSHIENNRNLAQIVLGLLDKIIRDSIAFPLGNVASISCYKMGARQLYSIMSPLKAVKFHDIIVQTLYDINTNVNINIELSAFCAKISTEFI